jgi:hypothetical protein
MARPFGGVGPNGPADMLLRDHVAVEAMRGLIYALSQPVPADQAPDLRGLEMRVALAAYRYADAMLKARQLPAQTDGLKR